MQGAELAHTPHQLSQKGSSQEWGELAGRGWGMVPGGEKGLRGLEWEPMDYLTRSP